MSNFTESVVEEAALEWLAGLGYTVLHGPEIAAGEPGAERTDPGYRDVVLQTRLRKALKRLSCSHTTSSSSSPMAWRHELDH
jgi:type I restriction enzyme R subunit